MGIQRIVRRNSSNRNSSNNSLGPKLASIHNAKIAVKSEESYLKQNITSFNYRYVTNLFIVYELDTWPSYLNMEFTLGDCLFGAVKVTGNADSDKYEYSAYGIGFDACSKFSFPIGE